MPLDLSAIDRVPSGFHSAPPERRGLPGWALLTPPAAGAADAFTTARIIRGGGYELNPLARPWANAPVSAMYVAKIGAGVGVSLLAQRAAKRSHRRSAAIALALGTLGPGVCALWNIRQERMRR